MCRVQFTITTIQKCCSHAKIQEKLLISWWVMTDDGSSSSAISKLFPFQCFFGYFFLPQTASNKSFSSAISQTLAWSVYPSKTWTSLCEKKPIWINDGSKHVFVSSMSSRSLSPPTQLSPARRRHRSSTVNLHCIPCTRDILLVKAKY